MTPGSFADGTITDEEYHKLSEATRAEAFRKWPTLIDYLKFVYDTDIQGTAFQAVFAPKRIVPPGGYSSPKTASAALWSTFCEVAMKHANQMTIAPTEISSLLMVYRILHHGVPIFYVADDFIRAVAATELPGDFTLSELNWPMPSMVLAFPEKFMREYTGRDVSYVMCSNVPGGSHPPPAFARSTLPIIDCPDKMVFQFHTYREGNLESYVTSWLMRDRVSDTATKYRYTDYTRAQDAKVEDDRHVTEKIGALLLKLLMVLNIRPTVVEREKVTRPASINKRTKQKEHDELWAPNIIGFSYRAQRQERGDSHASPRWHWRRGHITHQRVGSPKDPGFVSIASLPRVQQGDDKGKVDWSLVTEETRLAFWRCHKRLWLEPTLINFDESEEAAPAPTAT